MNQKWIYILILGLNSFCSLAQLGNKKIISPYPASLNEVLLESNKSIIAKIGKENFDNWLDSMLVAEIPYNNGCQGTHRPCNPIPPMKSDIGRVGITYYFTIPGFGNYVNSNYGYQGEKNKMVFEDHAIFPDCVKYPFKCRFLTKDSLFTLAKEMLMISDTSQIRSSGPYYHAGNFAYLFQTGQGSITLSVNNGEVLKYSYFGPSSSYNCSVSQKCSLNDSWLDEVKKMLRLDDAFKLVGNSPKQYGGIKCSWQFTSDKAYLILNGKDGIVLSYINYAGPTSDYKKK